MAAAPCPSPQQLQQLLLGRLPDAQADALEQHLSACPSCAQTVTSLKFDDTLAESLRGGAEVVRRIDQDVPAELLARLQALAATTAPADGAGDDSSADDASVAAPRTFDFLAPP